MWQVESGHHIAKVEGRGVGVRPMIFFKDNVRVASAQEAAVLVSFKSKIHIYMYACLQ